MLHWTYLKWRTDILDSCWKRPDAIIGTVFASKHNLEATGVGTSLIWSLAYWPAGTQSYLFSCSISKNFAKTCFCVFANLSNAKILAYSGGRDSWNLENYFSDVPKVWDNQYAITISWSYYLWVPWRGPEWLETSIFGETFSSRIVQWSIHFIWIFWNTKGEKKHQQRNKSFQYLKKKMLIIVGSGKWEVPSSSACAALIFLISSSICSLVKLSSSCMTRKEFNLWLHISN